jgi:hypothetical protein
MDDAQFLTRIRLLKRLCWLALFGVVLIATSDKRIHITLMGSHDVIESRMTEPGKLKSNEQEFSSKRLIVVRADARGSFD